MKLLICQQLFLKFLHAQTQIIYEQYSSFQDPVYEEFGLVDSNNVPCLLLKFRAKIYNFNLNNTDIATEV